MLFPAVHNWARIAQLSILARLQRVLRAERSIDNRIIAISMNIHSSDSQSVSAEV